MIFCCNPSSPELEPRCSYVHESLATDEDRFGLPWQLFGFLALDAQIDDTTLPVSFG